MTKESAIMEVLRAIAQSQERIAQSLEMIAYGVNILVAEKTQSIEPKLKRKLEEYPGFDWVTIGAEVVGYDEYGATEVMWGGHTWTRRRSKNEDQYGQSIWFNRTIAGEDGGARYLKLITFAEKTATIKPISADLKERLPIAATARQIAQTQEKMPQSDRPVLSGGSAIAPQPAAKQNTYVGTVEAHEAIEADLALDNLYIEAYAGVRRVLGFVGFAIDENRIEAFLKRVGAPTFESCPTIQKHSLCVQMLKEGIAQKMPDRKREIEMLGVMARSRASFKNAGDLIDCVDRLEKVDIPF